IALWEQLADDGVAPARRAGSLARGELSILLDLRSRRPDLARLFQQRYARLARSTAAGDGGPEVRLELLWNLTILGQIHQSKDPAAAARYWQQGREVGRRVIQELPEDPLGWYFLAICSQPPSPSDTAGPALEETTRRFARAVRLFEEQRRRDPADQTS